MAAHWVRKQHTGPNKICASVLAMTHLRVGGDSSETTRVGSRVLAGVSAAELRMRLVFFCFPSGVSVQQHV